MAISGITIGRSGRASSNKVPPTQGERRPLLARASRRSAIAALMVSVSVACLTPVAAHADDDEYVPGGEVVGMEPPMSALQYALTPYALTNKLTVDAQNQLMDLYALKQSAVALGEATSALDGLIATVQQTVEDLTGLPIVEIAPEPGTILGNGDANTEEAADGTADIVPAAFMTSTSPPSEFTLGTRQVGQQRNWWCGPATGFVVLKYKNKLTKNGVNLSQAALAGSGYMRTDQHYNAGTGATNWGDGDMARGLNNWGSLAYTQVSNPGSSRLKTYLQSKIPSGRPLPLATYEAGGGQHYNYHPNSSTIRHWITGYGYTTSGTIVKYHDSATTIPGWTGVTPSRTMQTVNMANFISRYGVVV